MTGLQVDTCFSRAAALRWRPGPGSDPPAGLRISRACGIFATQLSRWHIVHLAHSLLHTAYTDRETGRIGMNPGSHPTESITP